MTTVSLLILAFLAFLCALCLLPWGIEWERDSGITRLRLIAAGIRIPVPRLWNRLRARRVSTVARQRKTKRTHLALSLITEFELEDLPLGWRLVRRLIACFHWRVHRAHLVIATPNVALTGFLYGLACAAAPLVPSVPLTVRPDFQTDTSHFAGRARLTVIPAHLVAGLACSAWHLVRRRPGRMRRVVSILRKKGKE